MRQVPRGGIQPHCESAGCLGNTGLTLPRAPETASSPDSKSGCVISWTGLGNNSAFDSRPTLPFPGSARGRGGGGERASRA